MNDLECKPETTDALIDAIPENPYLPCPCGCKIKWRFVIKTMKEEEHVKRFYENYEKKNRR